jgi:hypothetical protein
MKNFLGETGGDGGQIATRPHETHNGFRAAPSRSLNSVAHYKQRALRTSATATQESKDLDDVRVKKSAQKEQICVDQELEIGIPEECIHGPKSHEHGA